MGVNGPLEGVIREVDGIRWDRELSGVAGIAGERASGELTPESLLVLLTRFCGSVTGAARRGSIGNGRVFHARLSGVVYLLKSLYQESFVEIIMTSVHRHIFSDHRG